MWFGIVNTPADIERELGVVNKTVIESFHHACPERKTTGRNQVPWWNRELKKLRKLSNRAFHKAYNSKSDDDWQKHREARRAFKKALRQSKRESWRLFCLRTETVSYTHLTLPTKRIV